MNNLLNPRFKVIADYPNNPYKIGELIAKSIHGNTAHLTTIMRRDEFGDFIPCDNFYPLSEFEKYPHLFKKLQWWEERKLDEMPDYVKAKGLNFMQDGIYQVITKDVFENETIEMLAENTSCFFCKLLGVSQRRFNYSHFIPATEEEYLKQ